MDTKTILSQLQAERARIDKAIAALEALDGTPGRKSAVAPARRGQAISKPASRGRRVMSPAARKRISEMMKKRWAERKKKSA